MSIVEEGEAVDPGDPPELCHINLARGFRGGERQTELLIRALAERVPRQRLVARSTAPLLERVRGLPGVVVRGVRSRLAAIAATADTVLLHAHETHGAQVALIRKLVSGTPYVITRRVTSPLSSSSFTRAMYRRADRIVALSRAIERTVVSWEPSVTCVRIPSAKGELKADRAWAEGFRAQHSGRFLVGHVGAYDFRHKGQDVLIEAADLLKDRRPDIHFVLVGAGRDEDRLRRLAEPLNNVSMVGWTDAVGDYLAAFDLFVFPSLHEGMGSTLIDALDFGLPVVASDTGGIPDLITHAENGLLVPTRDVAALADAIQRLHDDRALRRSMAETNKLKAREFEPAKMAARYLEVYAELDARFAARRMTERVSSSSAP